MSNRGCLFLIIPARAIVLWLLGQHSETRKGPVLGVVESSVAWQEHGVARGPTPCVLCSFWVCYKKPARRSVGLPALGSSCWVRADTQSGGGGEVWGRTCQFPCCPICYCLSHPPENWFSCSFFFLFPISFPRPMEFRQFISPCFLDLNVYCPQTLLFGRGTGSWFPDHVDLTCDY